MIKLLFKLLFLPLKLVLLPYKILRFGVTLVTCFIPIILVLVLVGAGVWFFVIR